MALEPTWRGRDKYYKHPTSGAEVPSVTTVLDIKDKGLQHWAAWECGQYAAANLERLAQLDFETAAADIKAAPWRKKTKAANLGSRVHTVLEEYAGRKDSVDPGLFSQPQSDEEANAVRNLQVILDELKPQIIASEFSIWSYEHGYSGTADLLCKVDGKLVLVDLKTSKDVYSEMVLQLAAYRNADVIITGSGKEVRMPKVDECHIWHAPKVGDGRWARGRVDDKDFRGFLAAKALYEWNAWHSKGAFEKKPRKNAKKKTEGDS